MVNESELPINVVTADKPKMLTGLDQNGEWTSLRVTSSRNGDISFTGEKAAPKLLRYLCGTWKTCNSPARESES